ncbi:hypothetical protein, partial [Helicobacter pylori]|uniref:hypothetical protein n=1 Tax=Helicobacter pylori TaxID=210 RepID=UPI0036F2AC3E
KSNTQIYKCQVTDNVLTYSIKERFNSGDALTRVCTLVFTHCVNIHNEVFHLKNINNNASNTVFYLNGMTTWKVAGTGVFTQDYSGANSVLVFNQTTPFLAGANPTSNSVVGFGKTSGAEGGVVGYFQGVFNRPFNTPGGGGRKTGGRAGWGGGV